MKNTKETKGITLVALILTIVILLILAVVTISSIQGEGIIAKAIGAREKYEEAADEEQGMLDEYLQKMNGISEGDNSDYVFDAEEWDNGGAPKDEDNVFIWKSNDQSSEDYGVVIGYTNNVNNYTTLRYPSRCTKISFDLGDYDSTNTSRSFTNNIIKIEIPPTVTEIAGAAFGGRKRKFI